MSGIARLATRLPPGVRRAIRHMPGFDRLRSWLQDKPRGPGTAPGELRAVVYLPTWEHWDVMRQRPQYLLSAFAEAGHPVYFVDHAERGVRRADGVTICGSLRDVPRSGVIVYFHFAPLRHLLDRFEDAVVIYDVLDDLSIYDSQERGLPDERKVRAHHPAAMERADLVLVSNRVLADRHGTERPDLILVQNGVDPSLFGAPAPRPPDLPEPDPERPIVGYHGMISDWFDFDLLEGAMRRRPDWRFVLVGPVAPSVQSRIDSLRESPNLTVIGPRPSDDMPGYVQGFDVGVIWFHVDLMTRGVTPLKMYEYLAAGVPCVATPLPACVEEPLVATAGDVAGILDAIERSRGVDPEQARAAAREHSWVERLRPVLESLDDKGLRRVADREPTEG
jgi:glycosyltransferase involved in cell wall biosynthesis